MISDQVVERLRVAAEELTGIPAAASPVATRTRSTRTRSPAARWAIGATSAACIVALLAGLVVIATNRRNEAPSRTGLGWSQMTVDADAGAWLDLEAAPEGLRGAVNRDLAATTVCLTATVEHDQLHCNQLEGQIASVYVAATAPKNPDETLNEIEIRTVFTVAPVEQFARNVTPDADEDMVAVTIRGHDGYSVRDDERGETIVVWSDRPGTINTIRTANQSGLDPIELGRSLEARSWPPDVRPPLVAVDFSLGWRAFDNNHPYALATTRGADECISIGYVSNTNIDGGLTACTATPAVWTIGTVADHTGPAPVHLSDKDAIAGLVPSSVTSVQLRLEDGRVIEAPTFQVTGFRHRAFGFLTDSPQGTLLVGELTGFDDNTQVFNEQVVAMMPTVNVDTICSAPGVTHVVPDVVGTNLRAAQQALRDAGLLVALPVAADAMPIVATQTPPAGTDRGCGDVMLGFATQTS